MKKQNDIVLQLSILYFGLLVVRCLAYLLIPIAISSGIQIDHRLVGVVLAWMSPLVMTMALSLMMIRDRKPNWALLLLTFVTYGVGAMIYPIWIEKRNPIFEHQLHKRIVVYSVALALGMAYQMLQKSSWGYGLANNILWTTVLPWVYQAVLIVMAIVQLRETQCQRSVIWAAILAMMIAQSSAGALSLILLQALFNGHYQTPNKIDKYLVILGIRHITAALWSKTAPGMGIDPLANMGLYAGVGLAIQLICGSIVLYMLIKDMKAWEVKGKAWRLLPILQSTMLCIIGYASAEQKNSASARQS